MRMRGRKKQTNKPTNPQNNRMSGKEEIPDPGIKSQQTCQITAKALMTEVHHEVPAYDTFSIASQIIPLATEPYSWITGVWLFSVPGSTLLQILCPPFCSMDSPVLKFF